VKRIGIALVVIVVVGGVGLYLGRGAILPLTLRFLAPSHGFDPARKAPDPDYASAQAWVARPDTQDLADYVPAGVADTQVAAAPPGAASKPVDVFFVHPTTYLKNEDWNDPLRAGTATEENTRWVLANQASAYNGCCNVYAPHYRQVSIFTFGPPGGEGEEIRRQALDLAYQDVARAFEAFLSQIQERPFLLAGHSQGTIHLRRLLREKIAGTPLAKRMVAAYLIGGGVNLQELEAMPDLHACQSATDLGCVVHWATFGPEGEAFELEPNVTTLCTNPLTWKVDGEPAAASLNLGAVPPSGTFQMAFWAEDRASGVRFQPLAAPLVGHVGAQCKDGRLVVDAQDGTAFAAYDMGGQNYHGLDYALFYMNIRANAQDRVDAYLASAPAPATAGAE
jgi:hypothetical protein